MILIDRQVERIRTKKHFIPHTTFEAIGILICNSNPSGWKYNKR